MEYEINRTKSKSGNRVLFYATKNGKRFTKVNYARKWEAKGVVKNAVAKYGIAKLEELFL